MLPNIKKVRTKIISEIEDLVKSKGCSYIDAVLLFCESNRFDVEHVAGLISNDKMIVAKLEIEAENLNFLKKRSARLPM